MNRELRLWKLHLRNMKKLLSKKVNTQCAHCKGAFGPNELFSYVDENNAVITLNSPDLCSECYKKHYGGIE
jgi:hypothetical protein